MKRFILLFIFITYGGIGQTLTQRFLRLLPTATDQTIQTFIAESGGTPLITNDTVIFLARMMDGLRPYITGDYNQWDSAKGYMLPIRETEWYYRVDQIPKHLRVEYSIRYNAAYDVMDSLNPHHVTSFGIETSEFRMPEFVNHGLINPKSYQIKGRLKSDSVFSAYLKGTRAIHLYEPPEFKKTRLYPVVFFHDGDPYIHRMHVHKIMDSLIVSGKIPPVIGIFVTPVRRGLEYSSNPDHRSFMASELLPFIKDRYSVSECAIIGSSRGALAAVDLAAHHPDIFENCIAISPAFRPTPVLDVWLQKKPLLKKMFIIESQLDSDWMDDARLLKTVMTQNHTPFEYIIIPQGHNQEAWFMTMDELLIALFR